MSEPTAMVYVPDDEGGVKEAPMPVPEAAPSPLAMLLNNPRALNDLDVGKVEALAKLHMTMEANAARQAFARAFALVQSEVAAVPLKGLNKHTNSQYAQLADVVRVLQPVLTRHGMSRSFSQEPRDGDVLRFRLTIRHADGHSESHYMDAMADVRGPRGNVVKTDLHGRASAATYCERHLLCKVFGLQLGGEIDDDGNAGAGVRVKPAKLVSAERVAYINAQCDRAGANKRRICDFYEVESFAQLTVAQADKLCGLMETRIRNQES